MSHHGRRRISAGGGFIPPSGLELYYDPYLPEGVSGGELVNLAPVAQDNATLAGSATLSGGNLNIPASSYAVPDKDPLILGGDDFTIIQWGYPENNSGYRYLSTSHNGVAANTSSWLLASTFNGDSKLGFSRYVGGSASRIVATSTQSVDSWYMFTVSRNGSAWELTRNNSSVATDTNSDTLNAPNAAAYPRLGAAGNYTSSYFDGKLGPILKFDRKITSDEMTYVFDFFKGRYGL